MGDIKRISHREGNGVHHHTWHQPLVPARRVFAKVAVDPLLLFFRAAGRPTCCWLVDGPVGNAGVVCLSVAGVLGVEVPQQVSWRLAVLDLRPIKLLLLPAQVADGIYF